MQLSRSLTIFVLKKRALLLVVTCIIPMLSFASPFEAMRTCIIVEPSPLTYVSGYANRFQALLQYLHDIDDSVQVVTAEVVVPEPPQTWLGFPIHYTTGIRLPHYPLASVSTDITFKIFRVIRKMKPDLIHVSSPGFVVFGGLFWSRIFQIPLVMSYHTHLPVYVRSYVRPPILSRVAESLGKTFYRCNKSCFCQKTASASHRAGSMVVWALIRLVHSFADVTVVTSPQVLDEFQRHHVPRCHVWQKGIDTHRFHPRFRNETMRSRMSNGHPDDFLLVYVGRLGTEKRLKDLRAALDRMPVDTRLCFVGTGPQENELKEYFSGFGGRCVFTGQLQGEELCQSFASGDVFLMPSDSETLGFVVLESMASGVPVVGAKAGGLQDLIDDSVTGFLVEPGHTDALVERLFRLKQDTALRADMSAKGRLEMEKWSWQAAMAKLRNVQYMEACTNFHERHEQRLWRLLTRTSQRSTAIKVEVK